MLASVYVEIKGNQKFRYIGKQTWQHCKNILAAAYNRAQNIVKQKTKTYVYNGINIRIIGLLIIGRIIINSFLVIAYLWDYILVE